MNLFLYLVVVLIWGTTWIGIIFQLGTVAIELSILYRFLIAWAVLAIWLMLIKRQRHPLSWADRRWCLLQGLCMYSVNYLFVYTGSSYLTSGLVALIFSLVTVFNALNGFLFTGQKPARRTLLGIALGLFGMTLIFWPDLRAQPFGGDTWLGLLYCTVGTYCFSLGNLVSIKTRQRAIPLAHANVQAMGFGILVLVGVILFQGIPWQFDTTGRYVGSLLYLAIPGTVVGFAAYLSLVNRIGADRAAYSTVLFPIVALGLSTLYEGYHWTPYALAGLLTVLGGNLLIFAKLPKRWQRPLAAPVSR